MIDISSFLYVHSSSYHRMWYFGIDQLTTSTSAVNGTASFCWVQRRSSWKLMLVSDICDLDTQLQNSRMMNWFNTYPIVGTSCQATGDSKEVEGDAAAAVLY